jgi:predicted SAM-dependent methyltransferase
MMRIDFLSESYRILESGGLFSIALPDTKWPLLDYAGVSEQSFFSAAEVHRWHPQDWVKTRLDHINYHFRQEGEHRYAYDFETLRLAMESAGFIDVKERDFDPTLDTEARRVGTLYAEARKP